MDLQAVIAELKRSTDTFGPFIRAQAERIPDKVALKFEDDTVPYGAYDRAVNRIASRLRREGIGAATPVAILAQNSPLFLAALGAIAKLGAIGALVNTHVTGAGLTHVLGASGARTGVCDAAALPAWPRSPGAIPSASWPTRHRRRRFPATSARSRSGATVPRRPSPRFPTS